jgi:hypothetical protein
MFIGPENKNDCAGDGNQQFTGLGGGLLATDEYIHPR